MYKYNKQGTEITLNLKFEKIGLHVDTARKTAVEKDRLGLACENVKLSEREYHFTNAFMPEQAMGNRS